MSGAEVALSQIVAEFRALGAADRRAILTHLRFDERLLLEAVLRPGVPAGGVSPELAALAQDMSALTEAARTALSAALATPPPPPPRPTLIERMWRR